MEIAVKATKRAGIKDVAALAGVSQATVSRALNADLSAMVTEDTRKRVEAAAKSLEYLPNPLAVGMQKGRSGVIGLMVTSLADASSGRIIDGAFRPLWNAGMLLAVMNTASDPHCEQEMFKRLYGRRVDGLLCAATWYQILSVASRTPMVLVNAGSGGAADVPCVVPDEVEAAAAAVAEFVAAGHQRIGFIGPAGTQPADRLTGYLQALTRAGLPEDPNLIVVDEQATILGGRRAVARLLQRAARPTAVLCYNDRMAAGAYEAARGARLEVPDDLSLIGFEQDGPTGAETLSPQLTTVAIPHFEMASRAATIILELISESPIINGERTQRILLSCNLHHRGSIARPGTSILTYR